MKWEDPPETRGGGGRPPLYDPVCLDSLRAHPGQWGLLASYSVTIDKNGYRNSGAAPAARRLRGQGFEATVRNGGDLYARWPK